MTEAIKTVGELTEKLLLVPADTELVVLCDRRALRVCGARLIPLSESRNAVYLEVDQFKADLGKF